MLIVEYFVRNIGLVLFSLTVYGSLNNILEIKETK